MIPDTVNLTDIGFTVLLVAEGFRAWAEDMQRELATARNVTWKEYRLPNSTCASPSSSAAEAAHRIREAVQDTSEDAEKTVEAQQKLAGNNSLSLTEGLSKVLASFEALLTNVGDTVSDIVENVLSGWDHNGTLPTQSFASISTTINTTTTPELGARSVDLTINVPVPTVTPTLKIHEEGNITGDRLNDLRVVIETIQKNDINALLAEVAAIHDAYDMSNDAQLLVDIFAFLAAKAMQPTGTSGAIAPPNATHRTRRLMRLNRFL